MPSPVTPFVTVGDALRSAFSVGPEPIRQAIEDAASVNVSLRLAETATGPEFTQHLADACEGLARARHAIDVATIRAEAGR